MMVSLLLLAWFGDSAGVAPTPVVLQPESVQLLDTRPDAYLNLEKFGVMVSGLEDLVFHEGVIYFIDRHPAMIYAMDPKTAEILDSFGGIGEGPGEFSWLGCLVAKGPFLFALDGDRFKVNQYDLAGNFIKDIEIKVSYVHEMAVDDDYNIYVASPHEDAPITVIDNDGSIVRSFGKVLRQNRTGNLPDKQNWRKLFIEGDRLYAMSETEATLEIYSLDGKLLHFYEFYEFPAVKPKIMASVRYFENYPEKQKNAARILIRDFWVSEGSVYALFWTADQNCRSLLQLDLADPDEPKTKVHRLFGHKTKDPHVLLGAVTVSETGSLLIAEWSNHVLVRFPL